LAPTFKGIKKEIISNSRGMYQIFWFHFPETRLSDGRFFDRASDQSDERYLINLKSKKDFI